MVITMAKLRMAHATTHGARKPPGPKLRFTLLVLACTVESNESMEIRNILDLEGSLTVIISMRRKTESKPTILLKHLYSTSD